MKAVGYSVMILLAAILIGQIILAAMGIQLISLQIAGGIILFLFGLQMIFGQATTAFNKPESGHDIAVFPLAIPSIVGPETIMVVIFLTDSDLYPLTTQAITAVFLCFCCTTKRYFHTKIKFLDLTVPKRHKLA